MIYNLPEMEAKQIEKAHHERMYRIERDRLKQRFYLYVDYPITNYYGLNVSEAKKYVYADFIARYERLMGRNVLLSIGYNNLDSSLIYTAAKIGKPIYSFTASGFQPYQRELKLLDIGFDSEKEILLNDVDYITYVERVFQFLYEKKIIQMDHGPIAYLNGRIYQKYECERIGNDVYSDKGERLEVCNRNYFVLSFDSIKKELKKEILDSPLSKMEKDNILHQLGYEKGLAITCNTTIDKIITVKTTQPEFFCGISFVALNPTYMDPFIYVDNSEKEAIQEEMEGLDKTSLLFTGSFMLNMVNNQEIPIFISSYYDEPIHLGIPSISDQDENLANSKDLPFNPIFEFVEGMRILVNSGYLNGYVEEEAHEMIYHTLLEEGFATEYEDFKYTSRIISSMQRFGVPIPLKNNFEPAKLPVVYDLKHEVRLENGEIAERTLIRDFLSDDFSNHLLLNAIRLKTETGILDFESMEALEEIGRFSSLNYLVASVENLEDDFLWNAIFGLLLKKYYVEGFYCKMEKYAIAKPILDDKLLKMERDNNNLVSVNDFIKEYGSTTLRLYYAMSGRLEESYIYSVDEVSYNYGLIDKIVKVFYYPIDDYCRELDFSYHKMLNEVLVVMKNYDVRSYANIIFDFIKKVHEIKHISRTQAKGLLVLLNVLTPSLAEQIKADVLNLKDPLFYFSFPE